VVAAYLAAGAGAGDAAEEELRRHGWAALGVRIGAASPSRPGWACGFRSRVLYFCLNPF
jgi:hypothetical protein